MDCCTTEASSQVDKGPTILIIGAGFGGLGCARQLVKNGATEKFNVILVDQKDYFSIGGAWQFVWNSRLGSMKDTKWLLKEANLPGIDLRLKQTVDKWIVSDKTVILSNKKKIQYDHIVLSPGVVADPKAVPGIENLVNICTEAHVDRQKKEMQDLVAKAKAGNKATFVMTISVNPYKCPPAPYELTFLVDELLRNNNVRDNVRVVVTACDEWTMPPVTKESFMEAFKEQDIEFMPNKKLEKIQDNKIYFKDGSDPLDYTVCWSVWPIRVPDFVKDATGIQINPKGFVTVDNKVTNTIPGDGVENAHIIGDACKVPIGEKAIPKAGEFAWKMGESVADAIAGITKEADRSGSCAAEAGFGKGFILSPNFSDPCNDPVNGKPKVSIKKTDEGSTMKVDWINGYLKEVFGDKFEPMELNDVEMN